MGDEQTSRQAPAKKVAMNLGFKAFCRVYQRVFQVASYVLPFRRPQLLEGPGSLEKLPGWVKEQGLKSVLVVTDQGLAALGLADGLLAGLYAAGIKVTLYDKTVANPTSDNIEAALALYKGNACQGIIAIGGGSPMDCAKGVGARVARPNKSLWQMKGVLRVLAKLPPLFAVPTTAGTGSEATVAAVITDPKTHVKYPINDMALIPRFAVLDPLLTAGLPGHITATTGMDALTHAVEAYIGHSNTKETEDLGRKAVAMVFGNLHTAYKDGGNVAAREQMLKASYYAGLAFTRAYVGNIHAMAHALGGKYGTPHGLANAVILPWVLETYGAAAHHRLARLSEVAGTAPAGGSDAEKAEAFIAAIRDMNRSMDIPEKLDGIREADIPWLADHAYKEANPLYPVPRLFSRGDFTELFRKIGS